ncbi:uncharacterized protein LOC134240021 [Saccostrea cucullata]|uniref:uncharacterized protein LOC134240021 n=1 Tax=Saccostrea cuccullata TaxID=36930 RepID=UPI002ED401C1
MADLMISWNHLFLLKVFFQIIQRLAGGLLDGEIDSLQNTDLDHSARSSVKRTLTVLTKRLQYVEKRVEDHIPQNIREQLQKKVRKWKEEDKLFVKVPAYQSVRDKLKSLPFVTVTGSGGRGKTFLIRHIALELEQEGYEIIPVSSIEEISLYGKLHFKQLFIIDDVLGVYGLEMNLYNNLSRHSENVLSLLESGSKLLISCRSVVFKESKSLNSFVTDINHVIDLDDEENELNDESIKSMLANYLQKEYFEDLKLLRKLPMFPLLCRLFSSSQKYQSEGEHFFLHPYQCIFLELDKMLQINKIHYAGLVYCVIKDNCVSPKSLDRKCLKEIYECCRLNTSTSNSELVHAMQVLRGSYLTHDIEGNYSLIHDSLFEIVAVHFGRRFQNFFIEHCTSSSIYNLLTFVEEGSICGENLIPVGVDHFPVLVDRIICDIKRFHLYEVFSRNGQFSQNEAFVSVFCKTLKNFSHDDFKQLFFEVETNELLNKKTKKLVHQINQNIDIFLETKRYIAIDFSLWFEVETNELLNKKTKKLVHQINHNIDIFLETKRYIAIDFSLWFLDGIIAYNHVGLLSGLIEIVRGESQLVERKVCLTDKNAQDSLEVIFGNNLESQSSCLSLACSSRSLDMVKLILSCVKHECINKIDDQSCSPLMTASMVGCTDVVKFLLKEGANINLLNEEFYSCLLFSCMYGRYDIAEILIKEGADVNLCTADENSPLNAAMLIGNARLVKLLITNGADINYVNVNELFSLFSEMVLDNLDILKLLIESDHNLLIDFKCLSVACENGKSSAVEYLIDKVDINQVNDNCDPALHSAASSGHLGIVEYLVEHSANVNLCDIYGHTPLFHASISGHLEILKFLLQNGADINIGASCLSSAGYVNKSPLCCASSKGYLDIVEELIKLRADVNLCDGNGASSLCYAAQSGHLEIVKYLLQNNADVNVGASCLSYASKGGHLDVVEFLIDKMDVNKVNDICDPPLHCASGQGHVGIVKYLVEHGAEVNLLSFSNDSPLCCAVEEGHLPVVEYLLEHGAEKDKAIEIAMIGGKEDILDFMLKHLN